MDILDSSGTSAAHRAPSHPNGPASARLARLAGGRTTAATAAAVTLVAGFAAVIAAQILPWARLSISVPGDSGDLFGSSALISTSSSDVGVASFQTLLSIPYHLFWIVVFGLAGATVFAPVTRRGVLFGASIGAVAAQAAILVPLIKSPASLITGGTALLDDSSVKVSTHHAAGAYCAIAALVIIAAALVIAVEGKVLPGLRLAGPAAPAPVWPASPAAPPAQPAPETSAAWPGAGDISVDMGEPEPSAAAFDRGVSPDGYDRYRRPVESYPSTAYDQRAGDCLDIEVSDFGSAGTLTSRD